MGKVTLIIFGAPPCSNCHRDFPLLEQELAAYPRIAQAQLLMYVETGVRWTDAPSAQIAEAYRKQLGLTRFVAKHDGVSATGRPSYALYTQLTGIPLSEAALPAAVIVNERGEVVRVFQAGGTSFVPAAIARALDSEIEYVAHFLLRGHT